MGKTQNSYDKQFVRNWLLDHWDFEGDAPELPAEVLDGTSARYREAFELISGEKFVSMKEIE